MVPTPRTSQRTWPPPRQIRQPSRQRQRRQRQSPRQRRQRRQRQSPRQRPTHWAWPPGWRPLLSVSFRQFGRGGVGADWRVAQDAPTLPTLRILPSPNPPNEASVLGALYGRLRFRHRRCRLHLHLLRCCCRLRTAMATPRANDEYEAIALTSAAAAAAARRRPPPPPPPLPAAALGAPALLGVPVVSAEQERRMCAGIQRRPQSPARAG